MRPGTCDQLPDQPWEKDRFGFVHVSIGSKQPNSLLCQGLAVWGAGAVRVSGLVATILKRLIQSPISSSCWWWVRGEAEAIIDGGLNVWLMQWLKWVTRECGTFKERLKRWKAWMRTTTEDEIQQRTKLIQKVVLGRFHPLIIQSACRTVLAMLNRCHQIIPFSHHGQIIQYRARSLGSHLHYTYDTRAHSVWYENGSRMATSRMHEE